MLLVSAAWADTPIVPTRVYGNLGYYFTHTRADGGAKGNTTVGTLSLNADSYIWRPWFATLNVGGSGSLSSSETAVDTHNVDLLETHLDFSLIPRSRYPFRLTYNTNNNVTDWDLKIIPTQFGQEYRSQYLNMRQSLITRSGDRYDAWYTLRTRNYYENKLTDDTFGLKAKTRGSKYNLYANGTYQQRKNDSRPNDLTKNIVASVTHNYFPTSEFYIKTLVTESLFDDGKSSENSSVFQNRKTDTGQLSSFFYWRPEYRPYRLTGGLRVYQRQIEFGESDNANIDAPSNSLQLGVDANIAGNYTINRRTRLTATVSGSALHRSSASDIGNTNQSVILNYRADKLWYREIAYHWFANAGIGNQVDVEYETTDYSQNFNAGIGHSAQRSWVAGNRSTVKANLTQSARETVLSEDLDSSFSLSHSATLFWNEEMRKGRFFSQLTLQDTRNLDDETETQILHYQFSRVVPINRLSQWGAHVSLQSSRRYAPGSDEDSFWDGFLTTTNGRLNYQHGRLFGIYKLKFRTKLDLSSTANRDGGDRKQADLESRLGYNIGKLSTALIGRYVWSDSGLGTFVVMFQLNRSF